MSAPPPARSGQPWRCWRYAAIDLEGTGRQDREAEAILEVAAVLIEDGQPSASVFSSLVNPGRPIRRLPWLAHGLGDADLRDAPPWEVVQRELMRVLDGAILVAHNARVDWSLLRPACPQLQPPAILDTLALSRKLYPELKQHRLGDLISRFDLPERGLGGHDSRPHRAAYDAAAAAHVFVRMLEQRFPADGSLAALMQLCAL